MQMIETKLGRLIPANESQTALEDEILLCLFLYRMSDDNPNNSPMSLKNISSTVLRPLVIAALDALKEQNPPLVEECELFQGERTFRCTGTGARFVRNMPQGMQSLSADFFP
jgi:hypothetical protein